MRRLLVDCHPTRELVFLSDQALRLLLRLYALNSDTAL